MPRCLYCGAYTNGNSQFCRGHNIAYKNLLIRAHQEGRFTVERPHHTAFVERELAEFGWISQACRSSNISRSSSNISLSNSNITGAFRKFGVELETYAPSMSVYNNMLSYLKSAGVIVNEEAYNHNRREQWKMTTDSSISGGVGREFVSPPFTSLEKAKGDLIQLSEAASLFGVKVNNSCGFHVHLDASDLSARDIARIVKFYREYELQIDEMHQSSRRGRESSYAGTLRDHSDFNPERINSLSDLTGMYSSRYLKVNLCAYARHGTVEFRQHGGTTNYTKIIQWVKFCTRVVEFAKTDLPINPGVRLDQVLNFSDCEKAYWDVRRHQLAG